MEAKLKFSFEEWEQLAREDLNTFEIRRKVILKQAIAQASPELHQKLEGLQFRIDMERRKARTPMASCLRINCMMMDHIYDELLPILNLWTSDQKLITTRMSPNDGREATILAFPDPHRASDKHRT